MKRKDLQELRLKQIKELQALLGETESELVKLRMEKHSGELKDTNALRKKRKRIAILKTLIREKELDKQSKT